MPIVPFLPLIISAGSSAVGAVVGAKGKKTSSTQTTTANYDPAQAELHAMIAELLKNAIKAGPSVPGWQKNAAASQVNEGYAGIVPKLEQQLASRGFGESGKLGTTLRGVEIGRVNELSKSQQFLSAEAQRRYDEMLRLAQNFTNPTSQTTTGSTTGPSNYGGAISQIGGDLGTMLMLRNMFANATSPGLGSLPGLGGIPDPNANPYGEEGGN